jgi:DNA-binding transcriptional MerR regulator
MQINELEKSTGVSAKTIRYYEEIALLPPPNRKPNGYRDYSETDVDRLKLVSGARRLDFSIAEIKEILDLRDRGIAPCGVLLDLLDRKTIEINQRISELKEMQKDLEQLYSLGATYPTDDVEGKNCICHLVKIHAED